MSDTKTNSKSSPVNTILILLLLVAAFAIGSMWTQLKSTEQKPVVKQVNVNDTNNAPSPTELQPGSVNPVNSDDHIRGNANAKLILIEYSDYKCPFCGRFHPTMQQVMDKYGDQVAWVYRHFPLDQLHPDARTKAEASECLTEQGGNKAFWKFTDALFNDQDKYTADNLGDLATKLGYDADQLESCLSAGTYTQKVKDQEESGRQAGITGTPGTFILAQDGTSQLIPGALPFDKVSKMVDDMLSNEQPSPSQ